MSISPSELIKMGYHYHQAGQLSEADAICHQILQQEPTHAEALHLQGFISYEKGEMARAHFLVRQAIQSQPSNPYFHNNLGNLLKEQGDWKGAIHHYHQAIQLKPDYSSAHYNLGVIFKEQGDRENAIHHYQQAIQLKPDYFSAHSNLGIVFKEQGLLESAKLHFQHALACKPEDGEAWNNLGNTLQAQMQLEEAIDCYRKAISFNPTLTEAHYNLATAYQEQKQWELSAKSYQHVLNFQPDCAEAYCNLGLLSREQNHLGKSILYYTKALEFNSDLPEAYCNLGDVFEERGELEKAIACFQKALGLYRHRVQTAQDTFLQEQSQEDYARVHSSLLFCLRALPNLPDSLFFSFLEEWAETHCSRLFRPHHRFANPLISTRRLKIGYVSPDFRQHSAVGQFLLLFQHHHSEAVEIFAYSDVRFPDAMTEEFQRLSDHWRVIAGLPHREVADLIQKDHIDILVDLAGHTAKNRLLVFARKPAPIQVTGFGWCGTTGMKAMDYLVSDPCVLPADLAVDCSETVVYLKSQIHWIPPSYDVPLSLPPVLTRGYITFGCGNHLFKVNQQVIALWAEILHQTPPSKLHLKASPFNDEETCQLFYHAFASHHIESDRIILSGWTSQPEHLAFYNTVDIALDPFLYTGGMTSCEALWMGVPIITLAGGTRTTLSLLSTLALPELIAATPEDYISLAIGLSKNRDTLALLRTHLRDKLSHSAICDGADFTREIEALYQMMWQSWCLSNA